MSGRRSEGARSGVLPYPWLSHDDVWRKGGKRSGLEGGNEKEETGTQVDPQTGELVTSYTGLIYCKIIMKIRRARLVAVPGDAFHQARTCPQADAGRDTRAMGANLSANHVTDMVRDTLQADSSTVPFLYGLLLIWLRLCNRSCLL